MKKLIVISLLLLFVVNGCKKETVSDSAASEKADSLAYYFERANDFKASITDRRMFTEKAIALISNDKNDSMNRVYYFRVANRYFNMDAWEDYRNITECVLKKSIDAKDQLSAARAYKYLGDYYGRKFIPDSSYLFYFKAENLYKKLKNNPKVAEILLEKSDLQAHERDYIGCEKSLFEALKFLRTTNNDTLLFETYNFIGFIYCELNEYEQSYEYHNKALSVLQKDNILKAYQSKSKSLNNIGLIFQRKDDYPTARSYYKHALRQPNVYFDNILLYATLLDNLAYCDFKTGDFNELPHSFVKALKIRDSSFNYNGIARSNLNLSEFYAFKKDISQAFDFAQKAYKVSKQNNLPNEILLSLKQLINVNPQKASEYTQEYIHLEDSLQRAERKIRNQFARIEYETEELAMEKETLIAQQRFILYSALILILLGMFVFAIRFWITRKRRNKLIQKQQTANDEIYRLMMEQHRQVEAGKQIEKKRISRELHDGVMGKLTSIRLNLFVLSKKSDPETINKCLEHVSEIQNIEKEIRSIAYDLEKGLFGGTVSFVTIVQNLFAGLPNASTIACHLDVDESIDWSVLNGGVKLHIYRILQQAIKNSVKHAEATSIVISMQQSEKNLIVLIADNGTGFNIRNHRKGYGIKEMKERAKEISAKINLVSAERKGTQITLILPYTTH